MEKLRFRKFGGLLRVMDLVSRYACPLYPVTNHHHLLSGGPDYGSGLSGTGELDRRGSKVLRPEDPRKANSSEHKRCTVSPVLWKFMQAREILGSACILLAVGKTCDSWCL